MLPTTTIILQDAFNSVHRGNIAVVLQAILLRLADKKLLSFQLPPLHAAKDATIA
jgi:hypothetical protein